MSSWNRDSPEALVVVQKQRIKELEALLASSRECHMLAAERNAKNFLHIKELEAQVAALTEAAESHLKEDTSESWHRLMNTVEDSKC